MDWLRNATRFMELVPRPSPLLSISAVPVFRTPSSLYPFPASLKGLTAKSGAPD